MAKQDKRIQNLSTELDKLQDRLLAEKLHASRLDNSLLYDDHHDNTIIFKNNPHDLSGVIDKTPNQQTYAKACSTPSPQSVDRKALESIKTPVTGKAPEPINRKGITGNQQNNANRRDDTRVQPKERQFNQGNYRRKQVLLVGTSNVKFVSSRFVAGRDLYVRKIQKYTTEEAIEYIRSYEEELNPEVVIYHLLCNDAETHSINEITKKTESLLEITKSKFPRAKVIISLGLPRKDQRFNLKVRTLNMELQNRFNKDKSVAFCDNSNLFYRGFPCNGILRNKIHLSKWGTDLFSENLREELYRNVKP